MPGLLVPWPEEGWHSAQELSRALVMVRNNETTLSPGFFTIYLLHSQPRPPRGHLSQTSVPLVIHTHTYMCTHKHAYTHSHTYADACSHAHTNIYAHTYVHTNIHIHMHTQIYTHSHTHVYTHTHTHMLTCTFAPGAKHFIPLIFLHKL